MAKKKPSKKKVVKKTARKPAQKKTVKRAPSAKLAKAQPQKKLEVTPQLRKLWMRVRRTYDISLDAFSNALSLLSDDEANMLYDLVRLSLYKGNPAQIISAHPQMKEFVKTDDDRICMHDIYEHLSWRLGRKEPMPKDREVITKFRIAVKGSELP